MTVFKGMKFQPFIWTLSADNLSVDLNMPPFLIIDPDGAKDLLLPAEADSSGYHFIIYNAAGGSENITVKEDGDSTTILTIGQGSIGLLWCDGTTWYGAVLDQTTSATLATLTVTGNSAMVDLDLGSSGAAGTLDVFPNTATSGKLRVDCADQDGDTTVTLRAAGMGQASVVSIPDPGASTANVMLTSAANDGVTVGATAAEIDAKADRSAQTVAVTATDAITQAEHEGRVNIITGTAAKTLTLPEAVGSGDRYKFIFAEVNTNGTVFVTADTTNCDIRGSLNILDADANAQTAYPGNADDDTITLNGTTTGGQIGDWIEFVDIATDVWHVMGQLVCPAGSNVADMFSSAA
jgi:hypothetical protein